MLRSPPGFVESNAGDPVVGIPSNPWGRKWQGRKRRDKIWNTFSVPSGKSCSVMPTVQSRIVIGNAVSENRVGINATVAPIHCRLHNGSAECTKVKVQTLYVFLVYGTMPTCKARNR